MTTFHSEGGNATHGAGLTRVQHGAPDETSKAALVVPESTRVGNQAFFLNGGGEVKSTGVARYMVGSDIPKGSVMATAQRDGKGLSVEMVPGLPASRTLIDVAVRAGVVEQTGDGYRDAPPKSAPEPEEGSEVQDPQAENQPFAYLDQEHLAEWNEMVEPLQQAHYDGAVASAMASIAAGDGSLDSAVTRLAKDAGMEPERALELVEIGEAMHKENLTRDLVKTGLISREEAPAFYDWSRSHRRLPEALSGMLLGGRTDVFRQLAREYVVHKQTS